MFSRYCSNAELLKAEGIRTNWQYRTFIQHCPELEKVNFERSILSTGAPVIRPTPTGIDMPFLFRDTFDTSRPPIGYCDTDTKRQFLEEERRQLRLISISMPRSL